ncbi:MAG TPA: biotin/lipoyl-binding protein [Gemmatales bacterium]|nr:biotin/lipoyl-binding protein [Gemmatales bacterium]
MIRKWFLPIVAVALFIFAIAYSLYVQRPEMDTPPPAAPTRSPYGNTVAGAGMVEPNTQASGTGVINVGSQIAGVVSKINVSIGQEVKKGDLLIELDSRVADAELAVRKTALTAAESQLRKLNLQPRPEEVPVSQAQVDAAETNVRQTQDQMERDRTLAGTGALSEQDRVAHEQANINAKSLLQFAKANLALIKAGAWEADKLIASAAVEQAKAQVAQAETMLRILQIQAPVSGTILQINVRQGEYISTIGGQSLIQMGNLNPLHVRVNIDEEDLPRLLFNGPARAKIRGSFQQEELELKFVRLEPSIVPKTSLTGTNIERVDTRVVQVIYALDPKSKSATEKKVLVGQLLDVFIDTKADSERDNRNQMK